jgi:uncharacterized protein (TIGR03435 family)
MGKIRPDCAYAILDIMRSPSLPPLLALLVGFLLGGAPVRTQSTSAAPPQSFDVASIKPDKSGQATSIRAGLHGRFVAVNATLAQLVIWAYSIPQYRLEGRPGWIQSDPFDINAKVDAEESTTFELFQARLQHLLADRFRLAVHTEMRELPQFALLVSKNGPKLAESRSNCTPADATRPAAPGAPGQLPPCDFLFVRRNQMEGASVTISRLIKGLSLVLKNTVIDRTGLAGHYDVHLEWTPDVPPSPADTNAGAAVPEIPGPSLFTALKGVGLQLRSEKGLEEVLVIDRAEQPSEN